jgi:hypothetical protein
MKLETKVRFAEEKILEKFVSLEKGIIEEKELGKNLKKAFRALEENAFSGIQIPKKLIPEIYRRKYDIDNLWKYNLPNGWRLLYSIRKDEILIITVIIDWLDHKEYEKRFKY